MEFEEYSASRFFVYVLQFNDGISLSTSVLSTTRSKSCFKSKMAGQRVYEYLARYQYRAVEVMVRSCLIFLALFICLGSFLLYFYNFHGGIRVLRVTVVLRVRRGGGGRRRVGIRGRVRIRITTTFVVVKGGIDNASP